MEEIVFDYNDHYGYEAPTELGELLKSMVNNNKAKTSNLKSLNSGNNLITNGSFDDNNIGTKPAYNSPMIVDGKWYKTHSLRNHANQNNDNGNNILKITMGPPNQRVGGVSQLIPASTGDLITASADLKFINFSIVQLREVGLDLLGCVNFAVLIRSPLQAARLTP